MRKSTKIMAGLGVVAGLGVALAPLATFAETAGTDQLRVTVTNACSLDPVSGDTYTAFGATYTDSVNPGEDWEAASPSTGTAGSFKISCTTTLAPTTYGVKINSEASYTNFDANGDRKIADGLEHAGTDLTFTIAGYKGATESTTKAGLYSGTVVYSVTFADPTSN